MLTDMQCLAIWDEADRTTPIDGESAIFVALRAAYAAGQAAASVPRGEPVAWREFDGEGGYDYRSYEGNENFRDEYRARNPGATYWDWVEPLYAASVPSVTVGASLLREPVKISGPFTQEQIDRGAAVMRSLKEPPFI